MAFSVNLPFCLALRGYCKTRHEPPSAGFAGAAETTRTLVLKWWAKSLEEGGSVDGIGVGFEIFFFN